MNTRERYINRHNFSNEYDTVEDLEKELLRLRQVAILFLQFIKSADYLKKEDIPKIDLLLKEISGEEEPGIKKFLKKSGKW